MLTLRMMSSYQYVAMSCPGIEVDEIAHANEDEDVVYEYYVNDETYEYDGYVMVITYSVNVRFDGRTYETKKSLNDSVSDVGVYLIKSSMQLDADATSFIEKEIASRVSKEALYEWEI